MKRQVSLLMVLVLIFTFTTACRGDTGGTASQPSSTEVAEVYEQDEDTLYLDVFDLTSPRNTQKFDLNYFGFDKYVTPISDRLVSYRQYYSLSELYPDAEVLEFEFEYDFALEFRNISVNFISDEMVAYGTADNSSGEMALIELDLITGEITELISDGIDSCYKISNCDNNYMVYLFDDFCVGGTNTEIHLYDIKNKVDTLISSGYTFDWEKLLPINFFIQPMLYDGGVYYEYYTDIDGDNPVRRMLRYDIASGHTETFGLSGFAQRFIPYGGGSVVGCNTDYEPFRIYNRQGEKVLEISGETSNELFIFGDEENIVFLRQLDSTEWRNLSDELSFGENAAVYGVAIYDDKTYPLMASSESFSSTPVTDGRFVLWNQQSVTDAVLFDDKFSGGPFYYDSSLGVNIYFDRFGFAQQYNFEYSAIDCDKYIGYAKYHWETGLHIILVEKDDLSADITLP